MVLFVFQFSLECTFGKFINFGLGTVSGERIKRVLLPDLLSSDEQEAAEDIHTIDMDEDQMEIDI